MRNRRKILFYESMNCSRWRAFHVWFMPSLLPTGPAMVHSMGRSRPFDSTWSLLIHTFVFMEQSALMRKEERSIFLTFPFCSSLRSFWEKKCLYGRNHAQMINAFSLPISRSAFCGWNWGLKLIWPNHCNVFFFFFNTGHILTLNVYYNIAYKNIKPFLLPMPCFCIAKLAIGFLF